jgi:hypothetical protein
MNKVTNEKKRLNGLQNKISLTIEGAFQEGIVL